MRATILAVLAATAVAGTVNDLDMTKPAITQELVEAVNKANKGWVAGSNSKFDGLTLAQASRLLGARKNSGKLPKAPAAQLKVALPVNFNVSTNWPACASVVNNIRDQSDCGCCWAFGSTSAFNDRMCIVHNYTGMISAQDTCSCCNGNNGYSSSGCDGGMPEDAWNYFVSVGAVTGGGNPTVGTGSTCFPYQLQMCDHHVTGPYIPCPNVCSPGECSTPTCPSDVGQGCSESKYGVPWAKDKHFAKTAYSLGSDPTAIQQELFTKGSVTAAFSVYSDFLTYKSGVYQQTSGNYLGGHAVRIVGWGVEGSTPYWLVANSWNTLWGDGGFFKILRGSDECGIEDEIVAGDV